MSEPIDYLKNNPMISDVIAEGFAHIYHEKPQFPITYLANFLKNYEHLKVQKQVLINKLQNNHAITQNIKKDQEQKTKDKKQQEEKLKRLRERQEGFQFRIKESNNHQEILNQFCEWIEESRKLTGVYIGQIENQWKKIDLQNEDGQQVHIDSQAPKVIKFKAASNSHNLLMIGKSLTLQSVVGKVLTQKNEEAGGQQEQNKEKTKPKGQIYIPLVQQNKQLTFFKYPRLGSFYAVAMRVRSYLHQKIFDANIVKTQVYRKAKEQYNKEHQQRQNKFRALYDERSASGADQKQLEQLEQNFQKEEENFPKPKLQQFEYILREFVICFDTLGQDREIDESQRAYCKNIVEILRTNWQNKERELLEKDIDSQLKLISQNLENPQQQALTKLIQQEDKQLPGHEEVEKVKTNEKLVELEINTLRIQKIRQYIVEEKYLPYLDMLFERRVLKFPEIMKILYIFAGFKKEEINYKGTNIFNWLKAKSLLTKEQFTQKITNYDARGSKPDIVVSNYAKWQRILKNLEKYDINSIAAYNIFLAFILRFLLIAGKVRIADNEARKNAAKAERDARQEKIKEAQQKNLEKQEKLQNARAQAEAKQQNFDEQAWLRTYEQENPPIQIGEEVVEEPDNDLQQEKVEAAPPS